MKHPEKKLANNKDGPEEGNAPSPSTKCKYRLSVDQSSNSVKSLNIVRFLA